MLAQFLRPTGVVQYLSRGKEPAISGIASNSQIAIYNLAAFNGSASTQKSGILRKLAGQSMKLYALESGVFVERPGLTGQVFSTSNNDGFAVGGNYFPNLVGVNSLTGSAATIELQYFNGTSFVALTSPIDSDDYSGTGSNLQVGFQPLDLAKGGPAGSGLDPSLYYLLIVATTAPGSSIAIDDLWAGSFLAYFPAIVTGGFVQVSYDWNKPLILDGGENIMPYYEVSSPLNYINGFIGQHG